MAAPKKTSPKKPTRKNPSEETEGRRKSLLMEIGDEAMRKALLAELKRNDWNLTRTAESLRMSAASSVIRSIHNLNLTDEYERAREKGYVSQGRPKES